MLLLDLEECAVQYLHLVILVLMHRLLCRSVRERVTPCVLDVLQELVHIVHMDAREHMDSQVGLLVPDYATSVFRVA